MTHRLIRALPLALLLLLAGCSDESAAEFNQRGNELFEQEQHSQALREYKEAENLAPDRPEPRVNAGNSRYEMEDYLGAIDEQRAALPAADPATQAIIHYNLGNAYYRSNEFEQAIESYKHALRLNPDDLDAKYNLELAQRQQEQQQQQQEQQGQDEQEQQGEDEQDPQEEAQGGEQPPPRPEPPPARMTPGEAERRLDELRRQEDRLSDETYENYAVGGEEGGDEETPGGAGGDDW